MFIKAHLKPLGIHESHIINFNNEISQSSLSLKHNLRGGLAHENNGGGRDLLAVALEISHTNLCLQQTLRTQCSTR